MNFKSMNLSMVFFSNGNTTTEADANDASS